MNPLIRLARTQQITVETYSFTATYYYYHHLNELLKNAKSVLRDGCSITVMEIPIFQPEHRIVAYEADDLYQWAEFDYVLFLGSGGSSAGIKSTISRTGDTYEIVYRSCLYDTYDWCIPQGVLFFFPSDSDMHSLLHETGLAKEYIVYGEMTETFIMRG